LPEFSAITFTLLAPLFRNRMNAATVYPVLLAAWQGVFSNDD